MRAPLNPRFIWASIGMAALVSACAAGPASYRLEAINMPAPGLAGGEMAKAVRSPSGWVVTRQGMYRGSEPRRLRLSSADGAMLDAALADPALYDAPQPFPEGCIDPDVTILDVTADGSTRRLTLECATSPRLSSVLRVLFGPGQDE